MASTDIYFLDRDARDTKRLNIQNAIIKEDVGYLLYPKVNCNCDSLRVADLGTGTGSWLLDLSKEIRDDAQLYGFDISSDSLLPKTELPVNMEFIEHNLLEAFSQDLIGTFDLVNIRFLVYGMGYGDWEKAVTNVIKLLKPGGWLQWYEYDIFNLRFEKMDTGANLEGLNTMIDSFWKTNDALLRTHDLHGYSKLKDLFRQNGLQNVEEIIFQHGENPKTRKSLNMNAILLMQQFIEKTIPCTLNGVQIKNVQDYENLVRKSAEEVEADRIKLRVDGSLIVGRKPLA